MDNNRIVVTSAKKLPYTKEYVEQLRREVHAQMDKIKAKPTLQDMFAMVDKCWENPIFRRQTPFENKDQHYAYITEYYKTYIEPATLEEYKQMVFADINAKLDNAEALLDSEKILSAAKEHKKQADARLDEYQQQIDDLKARNADITQSLKKDLKHD